MVLCTRFADICCSFLRITIQTLVAPLSVVSVEQEMEMDPNGYVTFIVFPYWPKHDDKIALLLVLPVVPGLATRFKM